MKALYFAILFAAGGVLVFAGQTNTGTNGVDAILALVTTNRPASPTPARGPTVITADVAVFNLNTHWAVYHRHVHVTDPQMKLTSDWLIANIPQGGGRITNIVASTNVVMDFTDDKGQKTHATGDKAVYFFHVEGGVTNETVALTGNPPMVEQAQSKSTGDAIIWDRVTDKVTITNPRQIFWQTTSAPALETNLPLTNNAPALQ